MLWILTFGGCGEDETPIPDSGNDHTTWKFVVLDGTHVRIPFPLDQRYEGMYWAKWFDIPQLQHNSLVLVQQHVVPANPWSLTIYRDHRGYFRPRMSESADHAYWRVLKAQDGIDGQKIAEGDLIRLCWRFSDQPSGYRDYFDDSFGRPRTVEPWIGREFGFYVSSEDFDMPRKSLIMGSDPSQTISDTLNAKHISLLWTYGFFQTLKVVFRLDSIGRLLISLLIKIP